MTALQHVVDMAKEDVVVTDIDGGITSMEVYGQVHLYALLKTFGVKSLEMDEYNETTHLCYYRTELAKGSDGGTRVICWFLDPRTGNHWQLSSLCD